jgi:hypothetical protein
MDMRTEAQRGGVRETGGWEKITRAETQRRRDDASAAARPALLRVKLPPSLKLWRDRTAGRLATPYRTDDAAYERPFGIQINSLKLLDTLRK